MSTPVRPPPRPGDVSRTGDDVLDWLRTDEARATAASALRNRRLPTGADAVDDLIGAATVAVLERLASSSAGPLQVANAAAYGTTVVRRVLGRQLRGADVLADPAARTVVLDTLAGEALGDPAAAPGGADVGDGARLAVEAVGAREPWVVAAALGYLTYTLHADAVPDGLPGPRAGSDPAHALAWPVLWLAGERRVFPRDDGTDPERRTRARRIARVLDHLASAFARLRREGPDV